MKKRIRAIIGIVVCAILILVLAIPAYSWTKMNINELDRFYNSKLSPVILIPGSSATNNRFDGMVADINQNAPVQHSLIKVKVWNDGRITIDGKKLKNDNEPFIVVGFENNHDGYKNIKEQSKMFNAAFAMLQNKYEFNNYKGIGHSNGGLVYTDFLERYAKNYPEVKIKKLLTMGTPFNFEETSIHNRTQMLSDFIKHKKQLPKDLTVYALAGTKTYTSDGIVPEESVRAGKYIYQNQVKDYTEITVTGSDAEHSDLPENDEVISTVTQRILAKPQPQNGTTADDGSVVTHKDSKEK
ncbi:alpha/beta hydrolase [Weissella viridescens]|uniref:alpha/beta hydrolase n=1 Tax=Weissella viridescens TaxID=1629 RepID=UPI003D7BE083